MSSERPSGSLSGSSSLIMSALSQKSPNISVAEEKGELIYIPQKCYGVLNANTPQSIKGLYTTGLNTCSGIVAVARSDSDKSIYFCHADTMTNLLDKSHGLVGWINQLPSQISKVELIYDDVAEGFFQEVISQIEQAVSKGNTNRKIMPQARENSSVDMIVLRNGETFCGGGIVFDFEDKGYMPNDETDMVKYCGNLVRYHPKPESPVCVFDGVKILSEEDLYAKHDWLREAVANANAIEWRNIFGDASQNTEKDSIVRKLGL